MSVWFGVEVNAMKATFGVEGAAGGMTEIEEIRQKYLRGELENLRQDLEKFICAHRGAILGYLDDYNRKNPRRPMGPAVAIKWYLMKVRSINAEEEIREQLREIEKEKWIRGVKSGRAPDPHEVAMEWARLYSPGWRAHRVTEIIFVFEQDRDRFCGLLR